MSFSPFLALMAMRRSRKLAWFCRARVGVAPRGILTAGGFSMRGVLAEVFEFSAAGVDVWAASSVL